MVSLNDRIKAAKSQTEIDKFLAEGKGYEWAKGKTRNKWIRAAHLQAKQVSLKK